MTAQPHSTRGGIRRILRRTRSRVARVSRHGLRWLRRGRRLVWRFIWRGLRLRLLMKRLREITRFLTKRVNAWRKRYEIDRRWRRASRRVGKQLSGWQHAGRRVGKQLRGFRHLPGVRVVRHAWKTWLRDPVRRHYARLQHHYRDEVRGIHLKERGRSYEQSFKGAWGKLRYERALAAGQRKKRAMFRVYNRMAGPVRLDVPFVYIPLHFQPERTTSSLGGVYADQYLLVDLIARSLPDGWQTYVKEHPSQFYPRFAGERSRHQDLYRDLAAIPRVRLVSLSVSTFELIDRSRAVATVTGTAGWEAVLRGRPALVVGSPWYRYCDGVFVVATERALREALAAVEQGYAPDPRKVRLFVKVLTELCARAGLGYNTPDEVELGFGLTEHVNRVVAVTERLWDRMQAEPPPSETAYVLADAEAPSGRRPVTGP